MLLINIIYDRRLFIKIIGYSFSINLVKNYFIDFELSNLRLTLNP